MKSLRRKLSMRNQMKMEAGTAAYIAELAIRKAQKATIISGLCLLLTIGLATFVIHSLRGH